MKKRLLLAIAAWGAVSSMSVFADESVAHGYQMGDADNLFGFISFPVSQHATPTMDKRNYGETHISAGECVDGVYYTYEVYPDVLAGISAYAYTVRDAKTFDVISTKTYYDPTRRVVDMTYDYTTNTMYALVETAVSTGAITKTALNIVDLATGAFTLVGDPGDLKAVDGNGKEAAEALITLAADAAGKLYAMGEYRQFYSLDKFSGKATQIGSQHNIGTANQFQSMAFDTKGVLYWAQTHPDYGYLLTIDPVTGVPSYMAEDPKPETKWENEASKLGKNAEVTGLWFEKAFAGTAPAAPTAIAAKIEEGQPNHAVLTWTLPTTDLKGNPVTVTAVKVYRLGTSEALATLPADAVTYTDTQAPNGNTAYYIAAVAGTEHGRGAVVEVFTGADMLMPVSGLKAEINGANVSLSWTAPTQTKNGGYADFENITYRVWRIAGDDEKIIAENVAETKYADVLETAGTFVYSIEPVSCGVVGCAVDSDPVTFAGNVATLPYTTGFEDAGDGSLWKAVNNHTNSTLGWTIQNGYAYQRYDGKFAQLKSGGSSDPCNDYFISPAIEFAPGTYTLNYMVNGSVSGDLHSWNIYLADGDTKDAAKVVDIESHENEKVGSTWVPSPGATFTVTEGGVYHLVLHGTTTAIYCTLKIDNLSVAKAPAKLPYACDFEEGSDADEWVINNNNAHVSRGAGWSWANENNSPHGKKTAKLYVFSVSDGEYNDWLMSPAIHFPEAGEYKLTFAAKGATYDTHKFRVTLGSDRTDTETFGTDIATYEKAKFGAWQDYEHTFSIATPGTYHIGIHGQGCDTGTSLYLDNIRVASTTNAVDGIATDSGANAPAEYFNLQGIRVANPAPGQIYIVKQGGKTSKQLVR